MIMSIIGTIYEDVTTDILGLIGPWQWMITIMASSFMFTGMFRQYEDLGLLKAGYGLKCLPPNTHNPINITLCTYHTNDTVVGNITTNTFECQKWIINFMGVVNMKRMWTVFCMDKLNQLSIKIVCRMGTAFGCVLIGLIGDSFGRKIAMTLSLISEIPLRLSITFCDTEEWFRLLTFLRSLFGGANLFMGLILICEVSSNVKRTELMAVAAASRIASCLLKLHFANYLPNMETLDFVAVLYSIILTVQIRWLPESPQWLLFNSKIEKAENMLKTAAKFNKIQLCKQFKIRPVNQKAYESLETPTNCIRILESRNIRLTFIVISMQWLLFGFLWTSFYNYYFETVYKGNYTMTSLVLGTILLHVLTICFHKKLRLKTLTLVTSILAGVFFVTSFMCFGMDFRELVWSAAAVAAVCLVLLFGFLMVILTPRLFGIHVRATMTGICFALREIGAMISHILSTLNLKSVWIFFGLNILAVVLMFLCSILLPDIDGRELPDTMEDMDYYSELTKPIRWAAQKTDSPSEEEVPLRIYSFGSTPENHLPNARLPPQHIFKKKGLLRLLKRKL